MVQGALDYSKLAAVYDEYCVFAGDVAFFAGLVRAASGEVLELMAGTGRLSLPLAREASRLTCVDNSISMLAVLRRKLLTAGLPARVVCADVCHLPFRRRFPLILLPFQGFTELATAEAQRGALREAAAVLTPSGRFYCTSHNPAVRLRSVDDAWHDVGTFSRPDGGTLTISLRCRQDEGSPLVVGRQRLAFTTPQGEDWEISLDLCFRLISAAELEALGEEAGLRLVGLLGDYAGSPYDEAASPAIVAVFEAA